MDETEGEGAAPQGLEAVFKRLIGATGPISVAHYMAEANAHYYNRADPLGTTGDFITAPEAARLGLINRAVAATKLEAETMALAQKIAAKLPAAIAMGKRGFYEQLGHETADAYEAAGDTMVANMMLSDTDEGISAFLEKRLPAWAPQPETDPADA